MNENCASCKKNYEVTPQNGGIVLYLTYERANHLLATCPNCKTVEVIYMKPPAVVALLQQGQFPMVVGDEPPNDRRLAAEECWNRVEHREIEAMARPMPGLPEAPREWVRQLHDDLRNWGRLS